MASGIGRDRTQISPYITEDYAEGTRTPTSFDSMLANAELARYTGTKPPERCQTPDRSTSCDSGNSSPAKSSSLGASPAQGALSPPTLIDLQRDDIIFFAKQLSLLARKNEALSISADTAQKNFDALSRQLKELQEQVANENTVARKQITYLETQLANAAQDIASQNLLIDVLTDKLADECLHTKSTDRKVDAMQVHMHEENKDIKGNLDKITAAYAEMKAFLIEKVSLKQTYTRLLVLALAGTLFVIKEMDETQKAAAETGEPRAWSPTASLGIAGATAAAALAVCALQVKDVYRKIFGEKHDKIIPL